MATNDPPRYEDTAPQTLSLPPAPPTGGDTEAPAVPAAFPPTFIGEPSLSVPVSAPALTTAYELLEELGRGGMGVVYKARQVALDRIVALKMILAGNYASPQERQRFLAEAQAAARLQHPNIVQVHEIGEQNGLPYFSLEYCAGGNLAQCLNGKPLPAEEAAVLVETLARAVHHAHQHGVIHRDLKPANVLIVDRGSRIVDREAQPPASSRSTIHDPRSTMIPKIADFGLAKRVDASALTVSGAIMGTPAYMAPEQAAGQAQTAAPAADVYALGAILYECLTGRPPFTGPAAEVLSQVLHDDPAPPSTLAAKVPRDLETICLKCLAKEPARRYASALQLAQDLERFRAGEPILGRREGLGRRVLRRVRRHPVRLLLVVALLLGGTAGYWAWRAWQGDQLTNAIRNFDALLAEPDWSPEGMTLVAERLADLRRLGPEQADRADQRLDEQLTGLLQRPTLLMEEAERLRAAVRVLEPEHPDLAQALQQRITARLGEWVTLFDLAAPFAQASQVFDPEQVETSGNDLRVRGTPAAAAVVPLRVRSTTHVEFEAVFREPVPEEVALLLSYRPVKKEKVSGPRGRAESYTFELRRATPARKPGEGARPPELRILRNGVVLCRKYIAEPSGAIRLRIRRERDRLTFQTGKQLPLVFQDVFPLPETTDERLALLVPPGTRLERLRAAARAEEPAAPGDLERANARFRAGQYDEAAELYARVRDPEARFKMAICLLVLRREDECVQGLAKLAAARAGMWSGLASWYLWDIHLHRNRRPQADLILMNLLADEHSREVALVVPHDLRQRVLDAYRETLAFQAHEALRFNPNRITNLERCLLLQDMFQAPPIDRYLTQGHYIIALEVAGRTAEALALATPFVQRVAADPSVHPENQRLVIVGLIQLWLSHGQSSRALEILDQYLTTHTRAQAASFFRLRLERALVRATVGEQDAAERDLNEYLGAAAHSRYPVNEVVYAHLLRGYLRQRRQDAAGARAAWLAAHRVPGREMLPIDGWIATALAGQMDTREVRGMVDRLLGRVQGLAAVARVVKYLVPVTDLEPIMRELWLSPRGREYARRYVFKQITIVEFARAVPTLFIWETIRQLGFGGQFTAEQDLLVLMLARDAVEAYTQDRLKTDQFLAAVMSLYGNTEALGWGSLEKRLDPAIRGPFAYCLGHRYRKLKKPEDAEKMFQTARANAPAGSLLERLCRSELPPK